ncbi:MAG: MFS transporter [Sphingomonadales bacterium]|nr:MFS transporter [Sphingomonadales bacterium]
MDTIPPTDRASEGRLPRTVWVLGIVSLLMDLSSEIYHALLPAFLSYGMAALSKPLFPLASGAVPILGARFVDRIGKGIRGAPRDAMIADETPPALRGRAFGLRQSLDTVGAFLAPLAAVGLMLLLGNNIRAVFWIAVIPAALSFLFAWAMLREGGAKAPLAVKMKWAGFRTLDPGVKRLIGVGFLFGLARFSESFLILKAMDAGLSPALSPLVLTLFNLSYLLLAYPAGILSDRMAPRTILLGGIALLVVADLVLSQAGGLWTIGIGVILWGAHMALTQGVFSRMIADAAGEGRRAISFGAFFFVSGMAALLSSLGAGLIWDRDGSSAVFMAGAVLAGVAGAMLLLLPNTAVAEGAP